MNETTTYAVSDMNQDPRDVDHRHLTVGAARRAQGPGQILWRMTELAEAISFKDESNTEVIEDEEQERLDRLESYTSIVPCEKDG